MGESDTDLQSHLNLQSSVGESNSELSESRINYTRVLLFGELSQNKSLAFIFTLTFISSLPKFYLLALNVLLISNGATIDDRKKLSYIGYPFFFKLLISPLMDSVKFD